LESGYAIFVLITQIKRSSLALAGAYRDGNSGLLKSLIRLRDRRGRNQHSGSTVIRIVVRLRGALSVLGLSVTFLRAMVKKRQ
jgi:hypothetical protein